MAWSSSHNHMDFSSPPQQYQSIDEDPTFFNGESATQPPIATVAELFSTEYSFWGSLLQHDSTLLYPDFPFPSTMGPLNSGYMDQGAMPDFSTTWNSTIEDPAADSHHLAENTVRGPPLEPTSIAQQPTPRKVGKIPTTRGNRPRRANKKEDRNGDFECNWIGCEKRRIFSCKSALIRHIKTLHISPRSIECPRCDRFFNRQDNMEEHLGRIHREYISDSSYRH